MLQQPLGLDKLKTMTNKDQREALIIKRANFYMQITPSGIPDIGEKGYEKALWSSQRMAYSEFPDQKHDILEIPHQ